MVGPLADLRVIDAGNMIAGPMAAGLLGDYGADVIKIEHPEKHDPLRYWEPNKDGQPLWWKVTGRNKRLVTLDLSSEEGQQLLLELVATADVLVENFRGGTFERWGLGYERLSEVNESLVMLRISGFGQTGPYSDRPGYGTIAEAMSGVPSFTGAPDGPPGLPGFPLADSVAALFGAYACVSAIHARAALGGRGQEIDLALYEPLFRLVESQVIGYDQLGHIKQRVGNRLEEDAPRNAYLTADGSWIAISASSERTWHRLAEAIGRPELAADPRFASSSARVANVEELDEILGEWFRSLPREQIMTRLDDHDVVAGPILDISEIFEHPQYRARENIVSVPDEHLGEVRMQAPVPKFSRTPGEVRFAGRDPGRDNVEIYQSLLGRSLEEMDDLAKKGVI